MRTTRTLLTIAATTIGLLAATAPAQAAPLPTKPQTVELPGTDTADTDGFCSFPVTIEIFSGEKVTETTRPDGATVFRFTGHAKAVVSGNGESITYNVSGPGTQTVFPDGSYTIDAAGPDLFFTSVEDSQPAGVLQLAYTTGRVRFAVDANGQTTRYRLNGNSTDVCAKLGT
jgi:hypothetical protein